MTPPRYAEVIVDVDPAHLDRPFDYRIPDGEHVGIGSRVKVAFSGRKRAGWVVGLRDASDVPEERIRELQRWGALPWFDAGDLRLFRWVADRYAAPLGHVLRHALPNRVAAVEREAANWGEPPPPASGHGGDWAPGWADYAAGDLHAAVAELGAHTTPPAFWWRGLPGHDADALAVDLIARVLDAGRGAIVVAPDPRSPLVEAVRSVFGGRVGDHRSARADRTRYRAFLRGRTGHVRVAVGERSAVFAPVPDLGLLLVDDEANPAWKERRSPRHHVREVALARARFAGAVCVLRGDVPSAHLWRLLQAGHVQRVTPRRAAERDARPRVDVVDLGSPRPGMRRARLSPLANRGLTEVVAGGGRAVVLAARGGVGAALACTRCGGRRECPVCAGSLRPESGDRHPSAPVGWQCPACGWAGRPFACLLCGAERTAPLAAGAARLADELARAHPAAQVVRMEGFDAPGPDRTPAIAVMTRGSVVDEPAWLAGHRAELVVAPDADGMLSRPAVDAAEDTLRLWFAVARLAGRMIVQTRDPGHHAVQALVRWDPDGFWRTEEDRRAEFGFPPARWLARVAAPVEDLPAVDEELRAGLTDSEEVLGPTPDGAWVVKTDDPRATAAALYRLRQGWDRDNRGVRIDVDPVDGV